MLSTAHAAYLHAWPMPASVSTLFMPSPRQPCVYYMLSPPEVHATCALPLAHLTPRLSTGVQTIIYLV